MFAVNAQSPKVENGSIPTTDLTVENAMRAHPVELYSEFCTDGRRKDEDPIGDTAEFLHLGTCRMKEPRGQPNPNVVILLMIRRFNSHGYQWAERLALTWMTEKSWLAANPVDTVEILK